MSRFNDLANEALPVVLEQFIDEIEFVDWSELYAGITHEDPLIEGLALNGRWTANVAPGKAGKSTFTMHLAR